ncbi:MAG: hypothetical protein MO847_00935 [Candidatus Protistobacter heckmanni]|nr:hypothetical protein [Candidatus Protistobacter heckmanni]
MAGADKRDVDELERAGLIEIESQILPGHGRMKQLRVTASQFKLFAELA